MEKLYWALLLTILVYVWVQIDPYKAPYILAPYKYVYHNPIICIVDTLCNGPDCPILRLRRVNGKSVLSGTFSQCIEYDHTTTIYDSKIIMFEVSGVIGEKENNDERI